MDWRHASTSERFVRLLGLPGPGPARRARGGAARAFLPRAAMSGGPFSQPNRIRGGCRETIARPGKRASEGTSFLMGKSEPLLWVIATPCAAKSCAIVKELRRPVPNRLRRTRKLLLGRETPTRPTPLSIPRPLRKKRHHPEERRFHHHQITPFTAPCCRRHPARRRRGNSVRGV